MGRRSVGVLLCALVASAGCTGAPATPTRGDEPTATGDGPPGATWDWDAGIPVPQWSIGDWWRYRVEYASGERYDTRVVVHGEEGGNYFITAEDRELLLRAGITHYPTFGAVAQGTLNQFIHGAEVAYLRFPMKNSTWSAPYRDFTGDYEATFAQLPAGGRTVPGFITVMTDAEDGSFRFRHGWSPVTRWFTEFTFDFDGIDPPDVVYTLQDWGSNHTGTLPVVEMVDHVHRPFPAVAAAPPAGAPQPPSAHEAFTMGPDANLLLAMFAGAGGPGRFDFHVAPHAAPHEGRSLAWQPTAAGGFFAWQEHESVSAGAWEAVAGGAAQGAAFLFAEAYEVRGSQVTI